MREKRAGRKCAEREKKIITINPSYAVLERCVTNSRGLVAALGFQVALGRILE
jgi:hypothetical protein